MIWPVERREREGTSPDAEIAEVESRQRRLVKLFTSGGLPEALLAEESRVLSDRRSQLESQRATLPRRNPPAWNLEWLEARMPAALQAIRTRINQAEGEEFDLLLRAVDARITASREEIEIRGEVPLVESADQADLVTIERTSA